jgi:ankyrin repeat protein
VHAVDEIGYTALQHAAASTRKGTESIRVLLAHGSDVTARSRADTTPLHAAASSGQLDKIEELLEAGADILCIGKEGVSALHCAVLFEHLSTVQLLLERGADAVLNTMQCEMCMCCDLISALMMCKDSAILKLLLTTGGDVHAVPSRGETCLHIAARHNYSAPVVCLLIKAGADMNAVNNRGKTAAQLANVSGNTLIEQLLNRAAQQA